MGFGFVHGFVDDIRCVKMIGESSLICEIEKTIITKSLTSRK